MNRPWKPQEDELLRALYGSMSLAEIARRFERSIPSICGHARALGLRSRKSPDWTKDEVEFLRRNWGHLTEGQVARRLKRSITAVHIKVKRLSLGRCRPTGSFSAQEAAKVLSIDIHTVSRWIDQGWLKAKKRVTNGKPVLTMIMVDDLEDFLRTHPEAWDSRKASGLSEALHAKHWEQGMAKGKIPALAEKRRMPRHIRMDLMKDGLVEISEIRTKRTVRSCPEPEWLRVKRAGDEGLPARRFQKWTPREDAWLCHLLTRTGLTYREIAAKMNRSENAIGHHIWRGRVLARAMRRMAS